MGLTSWYTCRIRRGRAAIGHRETEAFPSWRQILEKVSEAQTEKVLRGMPLVV